MPTFQWTRGLQSKLAIACGLSFSYVCDLLHKRKRCRPTTAKLIEQKAKSLGIPLTKEDLLYPEDSTSPAFRV